MTGRVDVLELFTGGRSESNLRFYERAGYSRVREDVDVNGNPLAVLRKPLT